MRCGKCEGSRGPRISARSLSSAHPLSSPPNPPAAATKSALRPRPPLHVVARPPLEGAARPPLEAAARPSLEVAGRLRFEAVALVPRARRRGGGCGEALESKGRKRRGRRAASGDAEHSWGKRARGTRSVGGGSPGSGSSSTTPAVVRPRYVCFVVSKAGGFCAYGSVMCVVLAG